MKYLYTCCLIIASLSVSAQSVELKAVLKQYLKNTVPVMTVQDLKRQQGQVILLDAREDKEFQVSKIPGARFVGHDAFDLNTVTSTIKDRNKTIVVYCSIGVRSEQIAEKIRKAGYSNVYNLYGGIFEWKNQGYPVQDNQQKTTEKVHTYSKEWSKYLTKGVRVY